MKKEEVEALDPRIQEYLQYGVETGRINRGNIDRIFERLKRVEFVPIDGIAGYGGRTYISEDKIMVEICKGQLEMEAKEFGRDFEEYYYENVFHELNHASGLTEQEIEEKLKQLKEKFTDENHPNIDLGYAMIDEVLAQRVAQEMVEAKYKEKYEGKEIMHPIKHRKFFYNENGNIPDEDGYSYEYDSDLVWYGELEGFALDFVESLYGDRNLDRVCQEHFKGELFDNMVAEYGKRRNGIENLQQLLVYAGNIVRSDYYQQGYHGKSIPKSYSNREMLQESIEGFNKIIKKEKERASGISYE